MDKKFWVIYIAAILITVIGGILMFNQPVISDEPAHAGQIKYFLDNNFEVFPHLTVIPGYHIIIYGFCKALGVESIGGMRMVQGILLTLVLVPLIYLITRNFRKTILFYFFPTLFSFYFLIYTDLMSLFFVILAYYLMAKNKPTMSGIAILISMLIRQNNIVWLGMLMAWVLWDIIEIISIKQYKDIIKFYIKRYWMYILDCVLFLVFIIVNKGIIIYDRTSHEMGFYFSNIWFFLFIGFFLFLPLILYSYKKILKLWESDKAWYILGALILLMLTYKNGHWYNQLVNVGFMKNDILQWAGLNAINRLLYGLVCMLTLSWIMTIRLENIKGYLLYPFTIVVLGMSEMVDVRYYTIPIVFLLIFREEDEKEWWMVAYAILISLVMYLGIYRHSMFW